MDAVWFGCIPVFLADHYHPPLHGLLDWDQLAVSIPERQVCFYSIAGKFWQENFLVNRQD